MSDLMSPGHVQTFLDSIESKKVIGSILALFSDIPESEIPETVRAARDRLANRVKESDRA